MNSTLRITYTVTRHKHYDFEGDSRCDLDHAIKAKRREVEASGGAFTYQSWYALDDENEEAAED